MMSHIPRLNGIQTFFVIWSGQLISTLGSQMTRFGLLVWAYQQAGAATALALLSFFSVSAYVVVGPFAGVLADRLDRRRVMLYADVGGTLITAALLALYATGRLALWNVYLAQTLKGACEALRGPAYTASVTLLMPREHYARTAGLRSLSGSTAQVLAPFLAGLLLPFVGLGGVLLVDAGTFLIAGIALLVVRIPRPAPAHGGLSARAGAWEDIRSACGYIFRRPGLLGLLLIFAGMNLLAALTYFGVLSAMILARSGRNAMALAGVQSALGAGALAGSLLVSAWGGPKRQIHGVLAAGGISFLLGDFLFAAGRTVPVWVVAAFVSAFFIPFITSANTAIWQTKVIPAVQGRVFSVQGMLQNATAVVGYLAAGPLADLLFEPAMSAGGSLAGTFGWLVGTGPGAGMALMFVGTSILGGTGCLSGYLFRAVRRVEEDLPDHDAGPKENTP